MDLHGLPIDEEAPTPGRVTPYDELSDTDLTIPGPPMADEARNAAAAAAAANAAIRDRSPQVIDYLEA